eukprot:14563839-Alexandrium_andersonii.AAC.1
MSVGDSPAARKPGAGPQRSSGRRAPVSGPTQRAGQCPTERPCDAESDCARAAVMNALCT